MKTLIIILILASFSVAYAIEQPDTTKSQSKERSEEQIQEHEKLNKSDKENFIDKKGTGEQNRVQERKRKDVFIDKDGDGISDSRQGGMSFNKLRKRTGQKQGGSGSGGPHNSSGFGGGK